MESLNLLLHYIPIYSTKQWYNKNRQDIIYDEYRFELKVRIKKDLNSSQLLILYVLFISGLLKVEKFAVFLEKKKMLINNITNYDLIFKRI